MRFLSKKSFTAVFWLNRKAGVNFDHKYFGLESMSLSLFTWCWWKTTEV